MHPENIVSEERVALRHITRDIFWDPFKAVFTGMGKAARDFSYLNRTLFHTLFQPGVVLRLQSHIPRPRWLLFPLAACRATIGFYVAVLVITGLLRQFHFIHFIGKELVFFHKRQSVTFFATEFVNFLINCFAYIGYFIGLFTCVLLGRLWGRIFAFDRLAKHTFDSIYIYQYNLYFYLVTLGVLLSALLVGRTSPADIQAFIGTLACGGFLLCLLHSLFLFRQLGHTLVLSRFRRWTAYSTLVIVAGCLNTFFAGCATLALILNLFRG